MARITINDKDMETKRYKKQCKFDFMEKYLKEKKTDAEYFEWLTEGGETIETLQDKFAELCPEIIRTVEKPLTVADKIKKLRQENGIALRQETRKPVVVKDEDTDKKLEKKAG